MERVLIRSLDAAICQRCLDLIGQAKSQWLVTGSLIPPGEYHRFSYAIAPPLRSLTTLVVLARFILTDELTPGFTVSDLIGGGYVVHDWTV